MKRILLLVSLCLLLGIVVYFSYFHKEDTSVLDNQNTYPVIETDSTIEQFILEHLMRPDGAIQTNFTGKKSGDILLSESLGLWMEYLVLKEDEQQFAYAFDALQNIYQLENGLVSWQLVDEEKASTNALIDDLRIIESLFSMGEKVNEQRYIDEAIRMSESMVKRQLMEQYLVDFYDIKYKTNNDFLTLSYINMESIYYMERYKLIESTTVQKMKKLLENLPIQNVFYAQTYQIPSHTFIFDDEINLIDQLYIAIHLERAGVETEVFNDWLQAEFYKNHHLYGRYDAVTKQPTVDYESVAVYALAAMYGLERHDDDFSENVYQQVLSLQVEEKESEYYGGFVASGIKNTHSFDNLLALLAERMLLDAEIIR